MKRFIINRKNKIIITSVLLFLIVMFFAIRLRPKKGIDFSCTNNIKFIEIKNENSTISVDNKSVQSEICAELQNLSIINRSRPNINTEFIKVIFHFSELSDKEIHFLKNDFDGFIIYCNEKYYKNDKLYSIIYNLLK